MEGEGLRESIIHYSYDTMGRLLQEEKNGQKTGYVYDLCGNRLKKLDKKGKEEYTYNEKNQLVSWKSARGYTTYQYDQQGNLLQATGTEGNTFYSYNAFNQQTAVVMANGDRLESRYDPEKLRAQTKENGKIINFLYHQGELVAELNDQGEPQGRYILGYGVAAGWRKGKEGYNPYHLDEQNSTMYITGEKGAIQNSYHYDAFGVVEERQQGIENRILYTGQQYDQMTGQYYLRVRYYNPVLGRFLQEDVYRGDGLNLYAYCKNNPVTYYDPSGHNDKQNCGCTKDGGSEAPTVDYKGEERPVYRGGNDFTVKSNEVKLNPKTGNVKTTHGVSLDVNPGTVSKFGGAYKIESLPEDLQIIQRGVRPEHFEIVPKYEMPLEIFQGLLNQVVVSGPH